MTEEKNCLSCFLLSLLYFLVFISFNECLWYIPCQLDDVSLPDQLGLHKLLVFFFHGRFCFQKANFICIKKACQLPFKLNVELYIYNTFQHTRIFLLSIQEGLWSWKIHVVILGIQFCVVMRSESPKPILKLKYIYVQLGGWQWIFEAW